MTEKTDCSTERETVGATACDTVRLPQSISESAELYGTQLPIGYQRSCGCKPNNLNCLTAKEWLKNQLGV